MNAEPYQSDRDKLLRAKNGDVQAREEVIRENIALVKFIVRRFLGRGVEYDDLFQYGCLGLVKAVDRFDPEAYDVRFSTYAVPVIMGEIRRYLRDDGPIHVSRTIRERARRVEAWTSAYAQENGRQPSVDEIAKGMGMDGGDVLLALNCRRGVRSLDERMGDGELRLKDVLGTEPMAAVDRRLTLSKLLRDLTPDERALIVRRYFKSQTQTQIAREMGTSQVQISRMESRIIRRMREMAGTDRG